MEQISPHFSFKELSDTSVVSLSAKNRAEAFNRKTELTALAFYILEPVRALLGVPLKITSAYRCADLNKAVGGAEKSQHLLGEAADFIPLGIDLRTAFLKIKQMPGLHFGQLIWERRWIHISLGVPFRPLKKCWQVIEK